MNLADLAIRRPIFITCVVLSMLAVGLLAMKRLSVDLFPDITFPVVTVTTGYPGAGPAEIESLVSRPIEDEISTVSGIKRMTSFSYEGVSTVIAEFTLETDVKYAEQQVRDRVGSSKRKLPTDITEPVIRRIDPADQPIVILALKAELPEGKLYDVANEVIKPKLTQVNQVGLVEVLGGRQREIQVRLDRNKLKARDLSLSGVAGRLGAAGENVPVGRIDEGKSEKTYRALGEFRSLEDIGRTVVNFFGNDVPTTISSLGDVVDTLKDERSRAYINGQKGIFLYAFRQSGANTIAVVDAIKKQIGKINADIANLEGKPHVEMVRDGSVWIRANVLDVEESILIGIVLAVVVVFFFLGSARSTIITGLALPNSLIGAFILMQMAGFSINIMSLLALSLSVGLLVDDAIVVRENIFRHIEMGKPPIRAALEGTGEVRLAVIATTASILAVFGPVGFLQGVVGQFFKQFGLTICFAMMISLFDALTIAPMLSAYFAGKLHAAGRSDGGVFDRLFGPMLRGFDRFQTRLEEGYGRVIGWVLRHPFLTLGASTVVFLITSATVAFVPKTFLPPQDSGEFMVSLELAPGTNLQSTAQTALEVDQLIRSNKEVALAALTVGNRNGDSNAADFYVKMVPLQERSMNTSEFKEKLRGQLKPYASLNPQVKDYDPVGAGQRPFTLNLISTDQRALEDFSAKVLERLQRHPGLKDVQTNFRNGKPELQIALDPARASPLGVSSKQVGLELRGFVEGLTPAKFRENGVEYDVRLRLKEDQRDLARDFSRIHVPNMNYQLVRLADVGEPKTTVGPTTISRQDRARFISVTGDIAPGAGLGNIMADVRSMFETDLKLPQGMRYAFVGQAENFQELGQNMATAMGLGVLFIFLVLASLYESFVTPLTIMLALPLAICGSFVALFLARASLNIFSMIGTIMLLGLASKNSILLVDYAHQLIDQGVDRADAIIRAGKTRLRPILMTTMALIAGTAPIALGLNEASRQRTSMGVAIIGGLVSSMLLTLIVVPAAFSYIDRYRVWSSGLLGRVFGAGGGPGTDASERPHAGHAAQFTDH